jgi:hypothetical protein
MRLRNGEEKLPAFEGSARAGGLQSFLIEVFYHFEWRIFYIREALGPELIVHVIVYTPQPSGHILLAFGRICDHVFGQTLPTVFAG